MLNKTIKAAAILLLFHAISFEAFSQIMPSSHYFLNPYSANPSYAGIERGLKVDATYQGNLNHIKNAPVNQSLTADMGINDKNGIGLNIHHSTAGLFSSTQIKASYAYHLPLQTEKQKLNFGLSFGLDANRISDNYAGESNDPLTQSDDYNRTSPDVDFGISYTEENICVQASTYYLVSFLKDNADYSIANRTAYYVNASYQIIQQDFVFIPQIGYNGLKGMDDIFDAGAELNMFDKQFKLLAMYHSNNSYTFGAGFGYRTKLNVLMVYNAPPKNFRSYANQMFELALQYKVF